MAYEFFLSRRVEFHETDMAGIMHFSNFFRWMEICETEFYRSQDIPVISSVAGQVAGWPRVNVSCEYRTPLRFNDRVEMQLFVKRVGGSSVTNLFHFRRESQIVAKGEMTGVCAQSNAAGGLEAQLIPPAIRAKLQEAPPAAYAEQQ